MVDFSDFKAVKAWLQTQSVETRHVISSRAALRVLANIRPNDGKANETLTIPCLRAILTSAGRGSGRPVDVRWDATLGTAFSTAVAAGSAAAAAAGSAAASPAAAAPNSSASVTANSVTLSANSAALSTGSAAAPAAFAAASSATSSDSTAAAPLSTTLAKIAAWGEIDVPADTLENHKVFLSFLASDPKWSFWRDWYEAMWNGTFDDWELAFEVIKIADEVWEGEDAAQKVADEIERIKTRLKTNIGPRLHRNNEGKWAIEQDEQVAEEPIEFAIAQVEVALAAALGENSNNGLKTTSPEAIYIEDVCSAHRSNPSVVATSFWSACMGLQRNIGDVYPEDAALLALKNTLYTSVEELCEESDVIRNRIARLAALETRRYPDQQDREELSQVAEIVAEEMTTEALSVLEADIAVVAQTEKPPRAIRARLVNWLTTIGSGIDNAQKNEKRATFIAKLTARIVGWFVGLGG